jgi:Ca-activated chloride channel family protein
MTPLLLALALAGLYQAPNRDVALGNRLFGEGQFERALEAYDRARRALPDDLGISFNRGAALHQLGRHAEAQKELQRATEARDGRLRGSAFYNLGNTMYKMERFKEAVEAYKRALAAEPRDVRAKWNLELALRRLKEEEKKKKEKQEQEKPKEEEGKDQQQAQSPTPQQPKEQEQQQRAEQSGEKPEQLPRPKERGGEEHREARPPEEAMAEQRPVEKQDAEAILDALERGEKNLELEQARKRARGRRRPVKDY